MGFDLGLAQPIEVKVNALREALRDPRCNDVSQKARAIDARVMEPLRAAIGRATRLLVAPDGALNLVPFDAFVDEGGEYLIQRYPISISRAAATCCDCKYRANSQSRPIIVANPLFGEPPRAVAPAAGDAIRPAGRWSRRHVLRAAAQRDAGARAIKGSFPTRRS